VEKSLFPIHFFGQSARQSPALAVVQPRNVREAMPAPDADPWKVAMDEGMVNPKHHNVYEQVFRDHCLHGRLAGAVLRHALVDRGEHIALSVETKQIGTRFVESKLSLVSPYRPNE